VNLVANLAGSLCTHPALSGAGHIAARGLVGRPVDAAERLLGWEHSKVAYTCIVGKRISRVRLARGVTPLVLGMGVP
jgi:hypothetical protein